LPADLLILRPCSVRELCTVRNGAIALTTPFDLVPLSERVLLSER
jgi:hypothetical protein